MNPLEILAANWPKLLSGLGMTLFISILGFVIAQALALPLALARDRSPWWLRGPLNLYISFMRGTPILGQLFLVYYGSGQFRPALQELHLWSFFREPLNCALLVFILNSCAYQMEIFRGGLAAVPRGEAEAARAFGMPYVTALRRVILPNVYRLSLPALGNEAILLMKASAVASVITIFDLMGQTRAIFAKTFDFSIYLWAALIYLVLTAIFGVCWRGLERIASPVSRSRPSGA
jgi:polar amino acid transport system permease protein